MKFREGRKQTRRKAKNFPDLTPFDLHNSIDIANAHALLASMGIVEDCYDGLRFVVLAALLARRLSTRNPAGYFARILREGFTKFGPADKDHDAAKRILRELDA